MQPHVPIGHGIKAEYTNLLEVGEIHFHIFLGQLPSKAFIQSASGSRYLSLCSLTVKIADYSRGHDRNQQHGRFEHMHVVLIRNEFPFCHVMLVGALGLRRETADITLSGKEVIPKEIRRQPAPIVWAIVVDVVDKANILFRLFCVLHKAEESTLGSSEVLGNNCKERKRHRMQRAKLTKALLFAAHVQIFEVSDVFADGFHQLIFFRIPLFFHSRTSENGTAN